MHFLPATSGWLFFWSSGRDGRVPEKKKFWPALGLKCVPDTLLQVMKVCHLDTLFCRRPRCAGGLGAGLRPGKVCHLDTLFCRRPRCAGGLGAGLRPGKVCHLDTLLGSIHGRLSILFEDKDAQLPPVQTTSACAGGLITSMRPRKVCHLDTLFSDMAGCPCVLDAMRRDSRHASVPPGHAYPSRTGNPGMCFGAAGPQPRKAAPQVGPALSGGPLKEKPQTSWGVEV